MLIFDRAWEVYNVFVLTAITDKSHRPVLLSIVGPTAVGKSRLALALAERHQTHIISCDSRQIYKYMNIGTAKPTQQELKIVPHHFVDLLLPNQPYNAGIFEQQVIMKLRDLYKTHRMVIAVGGSTLYFQALWHGIDPMPPINPDIRQQLQLVYQKQGLNPLLTQLAQVDRETYQKIDKKNHVRVMRALEVYLSSGKPISAFRNTSQKAAREYDQIKLGLTLDREVLYERIDVRVDQMISRGLVSEVQGLLDKGFQANEQALQSIGYKEIIDYLMGHTSLEEAIRLIKRNSRRYAKRQMTYYRKYEDIHWFEASHLEKINAWLDRFISQR